MHLRIQPTFHSRLRLHFRPLSTLSKPFIADIPPHLSPPSHSSQPQTKETEDPYQRIIRKAHQRLTPSPSFDPLHSDLFTSSANERRRTDRSLPPSINSALTILQYRKTATFAPPTDERKRQGINRRGTPEFWYKNREKRVERTETDLEEMAKECAANRTLKWAKIRARQEEDMRRPTTKMGLVRFLVSLRKQKPPASWIDLVDFHSHPSSRHLVSSQSYSILLRLAHEQSNLFLLRRLLSEMDDRRIPRDKWVAAVLLEVSLKRGVERDIESMLGVTKERGWGGLRIVNKARDLGDAAKGRGDPLVGKRFQVKASKTMEREGPPKARPERPHNVPNLQRKDATTLVESLFRQLDSARAFQSVETWLQHNRPSLKPSHRIATSTPSPSPAHTPFQPRTSLSRPPPKNRLRLSDDFTHYASTSIVLLNILLKTLIRSNITETSLKDFVVDFVARHSVEGYPSLRPDETTLVTMLRSLESRHRPFERAISLVKWFGYEYGFQSEGVRGPRRMFVPTPLPREGRPSLFPQYECSVQVSLQVLNYAIGGVPKQVLDKHDYYEKVRMWWRSLDKGSPEWESPKVERILRRLYETDLLEMDVRGRKIVRKEKVGDLELGKEMEKDKRRGGKWKDLMLNLKGEGKEEEEKAMAAT